MARYIEADGNGRYKVYSTIVDDYILTNVTPQEIIYVYTEEAKEDIEERVMQQIEKANKSRGQVNRT